VCTLKSDTNRVSVDAFNACFVHCCTGSEESQKPATIPLIPPPKQPTLPLYPAGQGAQGSAAKPKSKKVCIIPHDIDCKHSV